MQQRNGSTGRETERRRRQCRSSYTQDGIGVKGILFFKQTHRKVLCKLRRLIIPTRIGDGNIESL